MSRLQILITLFALVQSGAVFAELNVVATLPALGAIAQEVGGEHIELTVLTAPSQDPHYVDPRPDYILKLNQADLLFANGLELEIGWLPSLQTAARNSACSVGGAGYLEASSLVTGSLLEVPTGKISRAQGDIHPGGNPHFLLNPRIAAQIATGLAERLAELDPENEDAYTENADRFVTEIERFSREQAKRFGALSVEQRRVISYHASLAYLYDWLGLERVSTVEPKPGIPPDPGHVATVLQVMKAQSVKAIIQESYYPTNTSEKLVELAGAKLVVLQPGADVAAGQRYISHMEGIADAIYDALQ